MGRKPLELSEKILKSIVSDLQNKMPQWKIAESYNIHPIHVSRISQAIKNNKPIPYKIT